MINRDGNRIGEVTDIYLDNETGPVRTTATINGAAPTATITPSQNCDPSYPDACLDPEVEDYGCAGGSGGPEHVEGPIRVRPPDPFDLDRDGDGWGCEDG